MEKKNLFRERKIRDFLWVIRQNPSMLRHLYEEKVAEEMKKMIDNDFRERMYKDPALYQIIRKGLYR